MDCINASAQDRLLWHQLGEAFAVGWSWLMMMNWKCHFFTYIINNGIFTASLCVPTFALLALELSGTAKYANRGKCNGHIYIDSARDKASVGPQFSREKNNKCYGIKYLLNIKANGQFWYVVKIQLNYLSSLNHNFIVLCELLMPCQLFAQKCSYCQEITQISKCSGSPRTLCHW